MIHSHAGPLPRHLYCWVDRIFTRKAGVGFEPAVWFGLVSQPGRVWGCTVMLECGAIYRSLPPHAINFEPSFLTIGDWSAEQAQTWDCFSREFSTCVYPLLDGLGCQVRCGKQEEYGEYLFSASHVGDGFSAEPAQAKEFTFVKLLNGRLTIQPTDRILWEDKSFTDQSGWPKDILRQTETWSCE